MGALSDRFAVIDASNDWPPSEGSSLSPQTKSLKKIVIVYEARSSWMSRAWARA